MIVNTYPWQKMAGGDVRGLGHYAHFASILNCDPVDTLISQINAQLAQLGYPSNSEVMSAANVPDPVLNAVNWISNLPITALSSDVCASAASEGVQRLADLQQYASTVVQRSIPYASPEGGSVAAGGTSGGAPAGVAAPSTPWLKIGVAGGAFLIGGGLLAFALLRK